MHHHGRASLSAVVRDRPHMRCLSMIFIEPPTNSKPIAYRRCHCGSNRAAQPPKHEVREANSYPNVRCGALWRACRILASRGSSGRKNCTFATAPRNRITDGPPSTQTQRGAGLASDHTSTARPAIFCVRLYNHSRTNANPTTPRTSANVPSLPVKIASGSSLPVPATNPAKTTP